MKVPPENIGREEGIINIGGGSPTMVRMHSVATAPHRVILATTDIYSRFHILSRGDIKTAADVKGKRIGYGNPGALSHSLAADVSEAESASTRRRTSRCIRTAAKSNSSRRARSTSSGPMASPSREAKKHGMNDLHNLIPDKVHMPGSGVNVLKEWLPQNRDVAARFIKATVEAIALMKTDKEKAFASMRKWYGINETAKLEGFYAEAADLPIKPYPSIEGLKNMQSVYKWRAITMKKPEDFVDASFVTEARQEWLYRQPL